MKKKFLIIFTIIICICVTGCNDKNNSKVNQNNNNMDNTINKEDTEVKKITIEFDYDNGLETKKVEVNVGEIIPQPEIPIKEGYVFLGWYHEDKLFDFSSFLDKNVLLKAKWQEKTYVITFNSNGGSSIEKQIITKNEKIQKPKDPIKIGYIFLYWELDNKKYDFNNKVEKDIVLIAKWKSVWDVSDSTFTKYKEDSFNIGCSKGDGKAITNVNIGDKIVCEVGFETYAAEKVKTFKYTLSYGSGLKLIKTDNVSSAIKNGNTYLFTLNKASSVGTTGYGTFTFEVVGTTDLTYSIKNIKFITNDNRYFYTGDNINSLNIN